MDSSWRDLILERSKLNTDEFGFLFFQIVHGFKECSYYSNRRLSSKEDDKKPESNCYHNFLFQLPYWVSYVAFAIATILLGGILGLILVCCIDCIFPPRREDNQHKQTRDDKKDSDVEEDDDEDLEEIDRDSQEEDEAEDLSQNEDEEQSQEEQESQEDSPRISDNKARKRRTRKTD